jgi:hypothetical protein
MGRFGECLLATMRGLGISADGKQSAHRRWLFPNAFQIQIQKANP